MILDEKWQKNQPRGAQNCAFLAQKHVVLSTEFDFKSYWPQSLPESSERTGVAIVLTTMTLRVKLQIEQEASQAATFAELTSFATRKLRRGMVFIQCTFLITDCSQS